MSYEQRRNSGALFKNERRREGKNDPDYNGSCVMPNGEEFWISAWIKKSEGKKTFMSISFKAKQQKQEYREEDVDQRRPQRAAPPPPPPDTEQPF